MKTKIDMKTFDGLEEAHGKLTGCTVFDYNRVQIAVTCDGDVFALNYRSTDPKHLRNSDERATWARAVGVPAKDVEAYVRRKREQEKREDLEDEVKRAFTLLNSPSGKRVLAALKKAGKL